MYLFLGLLAFPLLAYKLVRTDKYRESLLARLGWRLPERRRGRPCLWLHGVSVGEVLASRRFLEAFRSRHADWDIAVSTTTRTGQKVASERLRPGHLLYFPFDFSWSVARAFDAVRPSALVLVELELWPGVLAEAARRRVPVYLLNGRITDRSFRGYARAGALSRFFLRGIELFLVQSELYRERLVALGVDPARVLVTGNMKHDNLPRDFDRGGAVDRLTRFFGSSQGPILLGASTHDPEELALAQTFRRLVANDPRWRLVLVPRHPERAHEVATRIAATGLGVSRWSEGRGDAANSVLVVDAIGVLVDLLPAASAVFVGGSWIDHGGQNVLEPAACGAATFVGGSHYNFASEVELLEKERALEIAPTPEDLARRIEELAAGPDALREMGKRGASVTARLSGASERNLDILMQAGLGGRAGIGPVGRPRVIGATE